MKHIKNVESEISRFNVRKYIHGTNNNIIKQKEVSKYLNIITDTNYCDETIEKIPKLEINELGLVSDVTPRSITKSGRRFSKISFGS